MSDEIRTERRGHVLVITINRPNARNAVNLAVSQGLADAVDELDADNDLSVGVLTGDSFTAEQGEAWGFVNVVTEPGGALDGAMEFAEKRQPNWTGT